MVGHVFSCPASGGSPSVQFNSCSRIYRKVVDRSGTVGAATWASSAARAVPRLCQPIGVFLEGSEPLCDVDGTLTLHYSLASFFLPRPPSLFDLRSPIKPTRKPSAACSNNYDIYIPAVCAAGQRSAARRGRQRKMTSGV